MIKAGKGLDRDQSDRSTRAEHTVQNKALRPTAFADLGRPAGRAGRKGWDSFQDAVGNPPANRNHRKPGRTVGEVQRVPRLPLAVGPRKKARLPRAELVHRYSEVPPLVPERRSLVEA